MKKAKRFFAILLSAVLILSVLQYHTLFAFSESLPDEYYSAPVLEFNSTANVNYDGSSLSGVFRFLPVNSGAYILSSTGDSDTYASVFDSDGEIIGFDDDSGAGFNFCVGFNAVAGDTYYLVTSTYSYDSEVCQYSVRIAESPIASIEFEDITVYRDLDSEIERDENGEAFDLYSYYLPKYTVHFKDGSTATDEMFSAYIRVYNDQYDNHWSVGKKYEVQCMFFGVESSYYVTVKENPITLLIVLENITLIENGCGSIETDDYGNEYWHYYYDTPKYMVRLIDTSFISSTDDGAIVLDGRYYYLNCSDKQESEHWTIDGSREYVQCTLTGHEFASSEVRIIRNPVSSIETHDVSVIENTRGFYKDDKEGERFWFYDDMHPVTDVYLEDGSKVTSVNGSVEIRGQTYNINYETDQDNNKWTVGNTYKATSRSGNIESTFNVTIVPIKDYDEELQMLSVDTPHNVSYDSRVITSGLYKFIPDSSNEYVFYSSGNADPYIAVFDETGEFWSYDDDNGPDLNFRLKAMLEAGNTYYVFCGIYSENSDFTVKVNKAIDFTCKHTQTEIRNAKAANCNAVGYTGDLYCKLCGQKLEDGEIIPITDHSYVWKITKLATPEESGLKEEICTFCGIKSGRTEEVLYTGHITGDINGDSCVDNKDLTRLFQYLSGWEVYVNEAALDVNGDNSVDNKDLTRLFQFLSGWDVIIF